MLPSTNPVIVVGISGATCSGKTTIAQELQKLLPSATLFCQDNYYYPVAYPGHQWVKEVGHINWDIVSSLDMERMTRDVMDTISKQTQSVIIVEGFCIFNYQPLAELCNLKYYFTLDFQECFKRRLTRTYEPPDVPGYFEKCVWPEHLKQLEQVQKHVKDVKYFTENTSQELQNILGDITKLEKEFIYT